MGKIPKSSRRTLLKRAEEIFALINSEEESFPKSRLKKVGLSPDAAEKWLNMIAFIQSQPRIRVGSGSGNRIMVERLEKKVSQMSLRYFLDETLPLEKRLQSLGAYADSVIVHQRLQKSDQ